MKAAYVISGIRVTEKETKKQIKPEKWIEKPRYCEDTGQLIGIKKVITQKEEVEYRFQNWSSYSFDSLIHELKFAPFSNELYIYVNGDEFYIGKCLANGSFYDSCFIDIQEYNNSIKLVTKHFSHQKMGIWIFKEK